MFQTVHYGEGNYENKNNSAPVLEEKKYFQTCQIGRNFFLKFSYMTLSIGNWDLPAGQDWKYYLTEVWQNIFA